MSLLSIAQWVQSTEFFTALRGSSDVYPIVMTLHLVGIAMFSGMVCRPIPDRHFAGSLASILLPPRRRKHNARRPHSRSRLLL